jgi:hypothetical protein
MARAPIRISFNGQLFSSLNQAAKITKISVRQIKKKLEDLNDPSCFEWFIPRGGRSFTFFLQKKR